MYRYIELNPVRAGMVSHPVEYPWSSYRFNGVGLLIELISPHEQYLNLGKSIEERQESYRCLFRGHIEEKTLQNIREVANKGWVLESIGSESLVFKNLYKEVLWQGRHVFKCRVLWPPLWRSTIA